MKIIGITGSSGSGKSTVANILSKQLKAALINADDIAKQMQKAGSEYFNNIVNLFGTEIIKENGSLNRKKIAEIIFQDKNQMDKLDNLTYKYVVKEIENQIKISKAQTIIIDAPLLIESKLNKICNIIIAVISRQEEQIKRICARDNIEENVAKLRIKAQKNNEFYQKNADYIIENNGGNYNEFVGKIRKLVSKLRQM